MRKLTLCLAASLIAAAIAPLHAQTAASKDDLLCADALSIEQNATTDPVRKNTFTVGVFYFLGRVDGRDPGFRLDLILGNADASFKKLPSAQQDAIATRCNQFLVQRIQVFKATGDALKKEGK